MRKFWWFSLLLPLIVSGCMRLTPPIATSTPSSTDTATALPRPTATFPPTVTATATSVPLIAEIDSPLQGMPLTDLAKNTSNPYYFKHPFSEGPVNDPNHPAVDLAFFHYKNYSSDVGFPIQAILPGTVVEALDNRYPYGNMVLIETPLSSLAPELLEKIKIPKPYSDDEIKIRSTCQPDPTRISWSPTSQSMYVLYAHMQNPPTLKAGDEVQAGELLGGIGASGHAEVGAEHLHLEIRVGPAEAKFGVISSYLSSSTTEERYNYCIWALSEVFQPIDPSLFWETSSNPGG